MKATTITEKNIKSIFGRVKKFFYNNNHTSFEEWHNFNCGFKKHISPIICIDNYKIRNIHIYPSPIYVDFIKKGTYFYAEEDYISVKFTETSGFCLKIGDKISFCGNRMIHKNKETIKHNSYVYSVYQVLHMSKVTQNQL